MVTVTEQNKSRDDDLSRFRWAEIVDYLILLLIAAVATTWAGYYGFDLGLMLSMTSLR